MGMYRTDSIRMFPVSLRDYCVTETVHGGQKLLTLSHRDTEIQYRVFEVPHEDLVGVCIDTVTRVHPLDSLNVVRGWTASPEHEKLPLTSL